MHLVVQGNSSGISIETCAGAKRKSMCLEMLESMLNRRRNSTAFLCFFCCRGCESQYRRGHRLRSGVRNRADPFAGAGDDPVPPHQSVPELAAAARQRRVAQGVRAKGVAGLGVRARGPDGGSMGAPPFFCAMACMQEMVRARVDRGEEDPVLYAHTRDQAGCTTPLIDLSW